MKKIIIATIVMITLALGVFTVSKAQGNWEWIDTGFDFILYDISFPEGQSQIGYAVGSNSTYNGDGIILKTIDGGTTWEQISEGTIPGLEAVYFTDLNTGYAGGWQNYFVKTTDGGLTWTEIIVNPGIWFFNDIEFWDENNGIAVGYASDVYITSDGGDTWTAASGVNIGIQDLEYASSSTVFAVGGDEKIIKSTDGGLNWTQVYSGQFQYLFFGVDFYNEDYGVVGGEDGKVMITEDGGANWTTSQASGFFLWHGVFCFNEDSTYLAGTPEGVYKTVDGGSNWIDDYPQSTFNAAFYKVIFTEDNNTGFICGSQGTIMRKPGEDPAPAISVDPPQILFPQTWVGETISFPLTISNLGNTTLDIINIESDISVFYPDLTSFSVEPGESQEVMITFEPNGNGNFTGLLTIQSNDPQTPEIYVDLNGEGLQQTPIISVADQIEFDSTLVNNTISDTLIAWNIGNETLNVSTINSSNTVFSINISSFDLEPGQSQIVIVSFTPSAAIYYNEVLEIVSNDLSSPTFVTVTGQGVVETGIFDRPNERKLSAYPNPFTTRIVVEYKSVNEAQNTLKIYDLFGKFITAIPGNISRNGNLQYIWNGTNQNGVQLPQGIYFGIIEDGNSKETIRIVKQ